MSTTMIIQPGPVVDFLIANQNVRDPFSIDWAKVIFMHQLILLLSFRTSIRLKLWICLLQAKRVLKNLRIKTTTSNQEFKITGLSEKPCRDQTYVYLFHITPSVHIN